MRPPVGYRGATKMVPPAKKKLLGGIDTRRTARSTSL
jgi:hypothetical protein